MTRTVKLTLVTDFICANCCVVEHELLDAISTSKNTLQLPLTFELEHMPFQLIKPDVFKHDALAGMTKEEFLKKHMGPEKFAKVEAAIAKWAEEKGVPISLHGVMSESTLAQRLSLKAYNTGGQDMQTLLVLALFKAHLQEAKDIGHVETISDIAEQNNVMSKDEAVAFLNSDELEAEVNQQYDKARTMGINGLPFVIIDGKWAIKGGHSSEVFVQIFKKLALCTRSVSSDSDSFAVVDTLTA